MPALLKNGRLVDLGGGFFFEMSMGWDGRQMDVIVDKLLWAAGAMGGEGRGRGITFEGGQRCRPKSIPFSLHDWVLCRVRS